jgi:hypothetical protein
MYNPRMSPHHLAAALILAPTLLLVALIGLVPIGVGVAYLIFYRVEGKNMAALMMRE